MTTKTKTLLNEALRLPENERLDLAARLLDSVPPSGAELDDDELEAELNRRLAEYEKDPSVAIPWSQAKNDV